MRRDEEMAEIKTAIPVKFFEEILKGKILYAVVFENGKGQVIVGKATTWTNGEEDASIPDYLLKVEGQAWRTRVPESSVLYAS